MLPEQAERLADAGELVLAPCHERGAVGPMAGVVSASHNPYPDNGIKFFSGEGRKLPYSAERKLERLVGELYTTRPTGGEIGTIARLDRPVERYAESVLERLRPRAGGVKVLLDCAHGAAYEVAPLALRELGVELTVVGDEPSGININEGVGSTHVKKLDAAGHDEVEVRLVFRSAFVGSAPPQAAAASANARGAVNPSSRPIQPGIF